MNEPTLQDIAIVADQLEGQARAETWTHCPCLLAKMVEGMPLSALQANIPFQARVAALDFLLTGNDFQFRILRHLCGRFRFLESRTPKDLPVLELENEQ